MWSQPPPPPVARAVASGETKGRLTAPARLPGTLGIPIEGCQLSTGEVRSLVIDYRPRQLRIDGRRRRTAQISAAIRFAPSGSHKLGGALTFSLHAGGRAYSWSSTSGTLRWANGLRDGSFDARLRPSGGAAGKPMRLRGTWRHCYSAQVL